jgi:PKD repeat protein
MRKFLTLFLCQLAFFSAFSQTIEPSGPVSFCDGGSVTLKALSTGSPTYQWKKDGVNISGATSQEYKAESSGSYSVTVGDKEYSAVVVTEKPNPVANFTFNPDGQCGSTPVSFSSTSSGSGLTYAWNFGDTNSGSNNTSNDKNPTHTFIGNPGIGNETFDVILTVTSAGCTNVLKKTVSKKQSPDASLNGPSKTTYEGLVYFRRCSGAASAELSFTNASSTVSSNTAYSINWGDGSADFSSTTFNDAVNHTYNVGTYTLKFTVTGSNGCTKTVSYQVYVGSNPAVGLGNPGNTSICTGSSLTFPITGTSSNPPGTTYTVTFNDGTASKVYTHPAPSDITHLFDKTSCGTTSSPYNNSFSASIIASNPCQSSSATVVPIYVSQKPKADFTVSPTAEVCAGTPVTFTNTSSSNQYVDGSTCNGGASVWKVSPSTGWSVVSGIAGNDFNSSDPSLWNNGSNTFQIKFTTPGTYKVTLKTGNPNCGLDEIEKTICVNPIPIADFDLDKSVGCTPLIVKTTNKSNTPTCGANTYKWAVSYSNPQNCSPNTSAFTYINSTNDVSANPEFQFTNPGIYTISLITYNSAGTCISAAVTKQITVKQKANVSLPATVTICQNGTITPSATVNNCYSATAATYAWAFSGGTPSSSNAISPGVINFNTVGTSTITLQVTNECGISTATQDVIIKPIPNVIAPSNMELCTGASTGDILFSSAIVGTTFTWTNDKPSIGLAASGTGNKVNSFNVTNNGSTPIVANIVVTPSYNGCTGTSSTFTITVNPKPALPIVNTANYCQFATATPLNATAAAGHTLKWYTASMGGTASSTPPTPSIATAGTFSYFVSQSNNLTGCESDRALITVTVKPSPSIASITPINALTCGVANGSLILNGLTAGKSYTVTYFKEGTIQPTRTLFADAGGKVTINNLASGTYSDIFVTLDGCSSVKMGPYTISDPNPPTTPIVTSNSPICSGSTLQLNVTSPLSDVTYTWTGPNGYSALGSSATLPGSPVAYSGVYSVTATKNGCTSAAGTVTVVINPTPATPSVTGNSPVCTGETINLTANSSTAGVSYTWTGPNTYSSTDQNPTLTNAAVTTSGTYTVRATLGACWSENTKSITVNPTPSISNVEPKNTLTCGFANGSLVLSGLVAGKTYTINYLKGGSAQSPKTLIADGSGNITMSGLAAGTYNDIYVTADGCSSSKKGPYTISDPNPPATPILASVSPICSGTTLILSVTTPVSGVSYNWTGPNSFSNTSAAPSIPNATINAGGTYSVTATKDGCTSAAATVTVVVNQTPSVSALTSTSPVCEGETIKLTSSTSTPGAINYLWNGPNSFSSTDQNPTISSATTSMSGAYKVKATMGSCFSEASVNVTIKPTPAISTAIPKDPTSCASSTGTISLNGLIASRSYTVNYSKNGSPLSLTALSDGSGTLIITNLTAGTYSDIYVTLDGCVSNKVGPYTLKDPNPPAEPTITTNSPICSGTTLELRANSSTAGVSYSWTGPNGFASNSQNADRTNVTTTANGTYTVTVSLANCTSSKTVTVTVNPAPAMPSASSVAYCLNATATPLSATATAGHTLLWYTTEIGHTGSATAPTPSTATATTLKYYVSQVATATGCEGPRREVLVVVDPAITNNDISSNQTLCAGASANPIGQTSGSVSGGNGTYTYQWQQSTDNGATWNNIAGANSASYSPGVPAATTKYRRVVTSNLCTNTSNEITVSVQGNLTNIEVGSAQTICAGTAPAALTGSAPAGGTGTFTYQWYSSPDNSTWSLIASATTASYQPAVLNTTTYYRRKITSGSCEAYSASVTITVNPKPVITQVDNKILCADVASGAISFVATPSSNVTYAWTNDNTAIGLASTGTGNIASFTTKNTSSPKVPEKANITVTPTYTNNSVGCVGSTMNFSIVVLPKIAITPISDEVVCTGTPMSALTPVHDAGSEPGSVVSYKWTVSGQGVSLISGSGSQIPAYTTLNTGATDLVATIAVTPVYTFNSQSCEGAVESYTVTVKSATPAASAGVDRTICAVSEISMTATASSGATGIWKQIGTPAATIVSPNSPTTKITGLVPNNTYEFEWTVSGFASCPSTKDTVVIINRPEPTEAKAGNDVDLCSFVSTTLAVKLNATVPAHAWEKATWTVESNTTGVIPTFSNATSPTSDITNIGLGAGINSGVIKLTWKISNDGGCEPSVDTAIIYVYRKPDAGTLTPGDAVCQNTSVNVKLNDHQGRIIKWRIKRAPFNDNDYKDSLVTVTSLLFNNLPDSIQVQAIVGSVNAGCNLFDTVTLLVPVHLPSIGGKSQSDAVYCIGSATGNVTLTDHRGAIIWEQSTNNGTSWTTIPGQTTATLSYNNLSVTTWYRARVQNGVCAPEHSTVTKITVVPSTGAANAGPDQTICNGESTVLTGNIVAGVTYTWTQIGGVTLTTTATDKNALTISGMQPGQSYTFEYQISNGTCPPAKDTIVILNAEPVINTINKRIDSVCVGTVYNTSSPAATGGNHAPPVYQWQSSTNGLTYADIPGATSVSYSFTTATTTWLIRKVTIGPCVTTSDTIIVRVIPNPDAANAGADLSLCYSASAQLKGNHTTTGVMTWKKLSATGATIDDANSAETMIRNLLPSGTAPVKHEFEYSIDNGICPARKDIVSVIVYPQLINKITPLKDTICNSQSVTLRTAELSGGNGTYSYQWQQSIDGVSFTNMAGKTDATLTFVPAQSLYLRRLVTSLPCEVYSDTAFVVVQAAIDNNQVSESADVCINTAPATIKGSLPTGGNGDFIYSWERSTDNGATWSKIAGAISQDYTSGPLTVDTRFRRIVSTNLCAGPQASISNVVIMTVRPDARAVFNPNPTLACPPFHITSAVVGIQTFPGQNKQYEWYADDVLIGTGASFPGHILAKDGDSVNIKLKAISLYGCLNDSISHYLYSQPLPRPAFDMSTTEGCGPLDVKFTNTTPRINSFTYKWDFGNGQTSTLAQPGTIVFPPNPTYGDTTYKISFTVFSICDTVSIEKTVRVKSKPKALFTPSKTIGCSPMTVEFTNTSLGIGNTYKWDFGDGTVVAASKKEPISHTFHTAERDTFYVKLTATNECGDDVQEYAIVVTPNTIRLDFAVNGNEHLGCAPHPVRFINNTIGATSFRWDFGDGNILSTTKNIDTVTHSYLTPGTYLVQLLATNGCTDTATSESITVFSKPVPAYTIDKHTVCIGDQLQFTNSSTDATSYLWKFGDGTVSTVVNPTHRYTKAGTYNVVLIAYRTSAPGLVCTDSVLHQVNVLSSMPGNFDASSLVGNCIPFTVTFTNKHQPSMVTTWDFGDGKTATGDVVTHTYTKPGNYTVSMSATVPQGCTYIATKVVQANGPYGELNYKGGVVCNNEATRFEATIVNTDKLVWNFGDGTTLTTTDRIVFHTYEHAGKYVPSVTLQSNTGCSYPIKGVDTLFVDKIKAGYQFTENRVCGTTTLNFKDTSHVYFGKKNITWDFGDGTTATGPNPVHTYTASGTYPVQMTITSLSGCVETITRQLNVAVYDKPVVDIVINTKPCTDQAIEFVANIAAIDPISHIQWTLSNGVKGTGNPFKIVFNTPGNYSIQVIVGTVNGCFDTASVNFKVDPSPVITASPDVVLCRGGSTNLSVSGAAQYAWSPLNDLSCTTCPNPKASPLTTTPYVVTGTNSFGCSDWDTVVVTVMQPFKMDVSPNDSICIGSSTLLQASGASSYRWSPATGLSSTTISNPIANPTVTTKYRVVGYDGQNCFTDTAFVVVAIGQIPTVDLGPDLVLSTGTLQPLATKIQNGPIRTWEWKPPTDLSCVDCPLPIAHIKKDITYTVKVTTPYGCTDTDTLSIKTFCESAQVFVPNAFTPDADGINDIAMVRGKGIVTVKTFRIFNRWGEVVFEKGNFPPNDPRYGWDGKVKGIIGGPDVFVYTADVICENGTTYTYKGNISIIK